MKIWKYFHVLNFSAKLCFLFSFYVFGFSFFFSLLFSLSLSLSEASSRRDRVSLSICERWLERFGAWKQTVVYVVVMTKMSLFSTFFVFFFFKCMVILGILFFIYFFFLWVFIYLFQTNMKHVCQYFFVYVLYVHIWWDGWECDFQINKIKN